MESPPTTTREIYPTLPHCIHGRLHRQSTETLVRGVRPATSWNGDVPSLSRNAALNPHYPAVTISGPSRTEQRRLFSTVRESFPTSLFMCCIVSWFIACEPQRTDEPLPPSSPTSPIPCCFSSAPYRPRTSSAPRKVQTGSFMPQPFQNNNCRFEPHVPAQVIHERKRIVIHPFENTTYLHLAASSEDENDRGVKPFPLLCHALRHQVGEAPYSTPWSPRSGFFTLSHIALGAEVTKR